MKKACLLNYSKIVALNSSIKHEVAISVCLYVSCELMLLGCADHTSWASTHSSSTVNVLRSITSTPCSLTTNKSSHCLKPSATFLFQQNKYSYIQNEQSVCNNNQPEGVSESCISKRRPKFYPLLFSPLFPFNASPPVPNS